MDRCNTCLEFTGRSFKAQSFSWTLIEAQRYLVEIGLRITGQVGFLGEVLSQQPVGVFVGASLPGALRITEEDLHIGGHGDGRRPKSPSRQRNVHTGRGCIYPAAWWPSLAPASDPLP